ncbi:cupin-like domain-containing protein [Streptomyces sp. NPDC059881]|uniref:cupin-like domain-containing protein n=1 Tax=Streptomyces sp. NPDC059881 TaxID=3346986 RepID=UPI0036665253
MTTADADTADLRFPEVPADFWEHALQATADCTRPAVLQVPAPSGRLFRMEDVLELGANIINAGDVSVNVDGTLIKNPVLPGTPPTNVAEFERYLADLAAQNRAQAVTYTRDYCLRHSDRVAMTTRSFISGFVDRRGIPAPGINVVYIAGHYQETWIGLHNDWCNTFLVPVHGRKKIMLWEPDYFADTGLEEKAAFNGICFGHIDVTPYATDALVLEAKPGEILFIPENWWHYNQLPAPETSLALSIGVFSNGTPAAAVQPAIKAALQLPQFNQRAESQPRLPGGVLTSLTDVELPTHAEALLQAIRDSFTVHQLARSTSSGVIGGGGVLREAPELTADSMLCGRPDSPVILLQTGDGTGLLFALGAMSRQSDAAHVTRLVEHLANGRPFRLDHTITEPEHAQAVTALARSLYERGVADLVIQSNAY